MTVSKLKQPSNGSSPHPDAPATKKPKVEEETVQARTSTKWHDDWPARDGPIDLAVHDLPHSSSDTEWWYINTHLKSDSGKEVSLFASFFSMIIGYDADKEELLRGHSLTWAITDATEDKYYSFSRLDPRAPAYIKKNLHLETNVDPHLRRGIMEVVEKNNVALPDTLIEGDIRVSTDGDLSLDFDGDKFFKDSGGNYVLELSNKHCQDSAQCGCSLQFRPLKEPARNRCNGVVPVGLHGDNMFYYFISRNDCTGSVVIDGEEFHMTGNAWYDHEFGGTIRAAKGSSSEKGPAKLGNGSPMTNNFAWQWLSVQLDNGTDITSCVIEKPKTSTSQPGASMEDAIIDSYAIVIEEDGKRTEVSRSHFKPVPGKKWLSYKTYVEYPYEWTYQQGDIDLKLTAARNKDQEFLTLLAFPAFWEGRVECTGTIGGNPVNGVGFIELNGHDRSTTSDLENLFKACAKEMRRRMRELMPLETDEETGKPIDNDALEELIGPDGYNAVMSFPQDQGRQAVIKNLLEPLRDVFDRGGKAWRSLIANVCIDVVGGNSSDYRYLLLVPELIHAGSLIIDDIQDKSETRRGKACCHKLWGEATAINAACFSYFAAPGLYSRHPDNVRLKLHDLYFGTMLAGHVGQGKDISGFNNIMPEVVETGNHKLATDMIVGIHRLKSGVPVRHMAQSGCVIGGGSQEQIDAIGDFFENVGIAFQIVDDSVNLQGFTNGNWKTRGEDVMEGKVTYPIALAMKSLNKEVRKELWTKLECKPQDMETVKWIIDTVRGTGALTESTSMATEMVEQGWLKAESTMTDSFSKVILRGCSLYILERLKDSGKPLPDTTF